MARPQQLQPGQLNPQSQPVSTFVQSTAKNVAGAARPQLLPQTPQLQTSQTGGTTFVQGENSFARLAADLKAFSPQLMGTAESAGLKYIDWQMDVGEQRAMEEVQRGLAQIDESMEVAENQRAADNRKVSAVDPQAGWLMRTLNPYQQIGYERGKVKMAGQQIAYGLPAFIARQGQEFDPTTGKPFIDFTAPDMGYSGLQKLQAQYQRQLESEYGINSGSPGYTKYFAPNLIRAQSQVSESLIDQRTVFFEGKIGPRAISATMSQMEALADDNDPIITQDGITIPRFNPDRTVNNSWIRARAVQLTKLVKDMLATAPLGASSKITEQLYETVSKSFPEGSIQRRVLRLMQASDGVTYGNRYGYKDRETDLQYTADEAKRIRDQQTIDQNAIRPILTQQAQIPGLPYGQAIDNSIAILNNQREQKGEPPLTPRQMAIIKADSINNIREIAPQRAAPSQPSANDPQAASINLARINNQPIMDIDVAKERQILEQIRSNGLTQDQQASYNSAAGRLDEAEKAQEESKSWLSKYKTDMNNRIKQFNQSQALFPDDALVSTDRLSAEIIKRMDANLSKKRNDGPVRLEDINQSLLEVWPTIQRDIDNGTIKIPGVGPNPSNTPGGPQPLPVEPAKNSGGIKKPGVDLNQLNNFPRRNNRLRNWRRDPSPILSARALIQVIQDAANGRKENPNFTKAWKTAKAPNAWSFIQRQMEFYRNLGGGKGWTDEDLEKAKQDLLSYVIRDGNRYGTMTLARVSPGLAGLNNWAESL